jgi:hypothetical protein
MKDRRHALNILLCYQYDIAVMGEEGPASGNFKLFFKGADMERIGVSGRVQQILTRFLIF